MALANPKVCAFNPCDKTEMAAGLCGTHYHQRRRGEELREYEPRRKASEIPATCSEIGCEREHFRSGWCQGHHRQVRDGRPLAPLRKFGIPQKPGEGRIRSDGYVRLTGWQGHPNAPKNGEILEHVLVVSDLLGRPLEKGENVHHRNGVRHDNRPSNLELWIVSQPSGQRVSDRLAYYSEQLWLYRRGFMESLTPEQHALLTQPDPPLIS